MGERSTCASRSGRVNDKVYRCGTCSEVMQRTSNARPSHYCSDACRPTCAIADCESPMKYRTPFGRICPVHYARWKKHGDPHVLLLPKNMAPAPDTCRQCAGPRGEGYAKWFCSVRCAGRWSVHIDEAETWPCAACPDGVVHRSRSRSDARLCVTCRRSRPPLSARELAQRDGSMCRICLVEVRLDLPARHTHRPAADHIVPRALGGPNTPQNLQLTHHRCNSVKQHRLSLDAETIERLAAEAVTANTDPRRGAEVCGAGHPRTPAFGHWERRGWCCRECKYLRQRVRRWAANPDAKRRNRGRRVAAP